MSKKKPFCSFFIAKGLTIGVRTTGLEPAQLSPLAPQASVSTNSTTTARQEKNLDFFWLLVNRISSNFYIFFALKSYYQMLQEIKEVRIPSLLLLLLHHFARQKPEPLQYGLYEAGTCKAWTVQYHLRLSQDNLL